MDLSASTGINIISKRVCNLRMLSTTFLIYYQPTNVTQARLPLVFGGRPTHDSRVISENRIDRESP